ncbi:hypothetical protein [Streptomyces graminilatus]|uniref:hypothetical protein n=1 Tax=Streptomyces graminilatus TaxID=1464070 RepID=UPI0006E2B164|nr:hypothetical protein [Streptomyces graminilatus]
MENEAEPPDPEEPAKKKRRRFDLAHVALVLYAQALVKFLVALGSGFFHGFSVGKVIDAFVRLAFGLGTITALVLAIHVVRTRWARRATEG